MVNFLVLIGFAIVLFGIYKLAVYKNRTPWGWIAICILLTPLAIIVLALMQKIPKGHKADDAFKSKKKKKKKK